MDSIIHLSSCPVCDSAALTSLFTVRDYTVSHKDFQLVECAGCSLRFTQDVPDKASIAAYYKSDNYISHTDTSKGLVNSLYKIVRKRTLKQKRKLVESIAGKKPGKLLDVGSGTGAFLDEMKRHGWDITGLEPDPDARNIAQNLYGLELNDTSLLSGLPPAEFDVITLWHVLEHVHDLRDTMAQLFRLLVTGGRLVIAVPNYTCLDEKIYRQYWAAYDVPRHFYHFSPQAMDRLVKQQGGSVLAHKPMWFDSFYVSLLSSKYRNGSTNWLGSLWTGLKSNMAAMQDVKKCSSVIYIIAA